MSFVCLLEIQLHFPDNGSLKGKRKELSSLKAQLQRRFGAAVAETVLAAVMVAGLEGTVFGLLPLRFLPGESVYAWNRVVWGALLAGSGTALWKRVAAHS